MTTHTFKAGDEVFSIHGEAGLYVARVTAGHLVEPIYDTSDRDEPSYAEPQTWREVFAAPPTQRLHEQVAVAEKELTAAREALAKVQAERRTFDQEERARLARIKQHEQLAALDDYLAGRITHFVVTSEYDAPRIASFEEAIVTTDEDHGRKNLRLLGLFGDPKRNLRWKIMWYSDGSGGVRHEVFPCTSLEQATARLTDIVNQGWDGIRQSGRFNITTQTVKLARSMGLAVPDDIAAAADSIGREAFTKTVANRREAAAKAQRELAEAEAAARAAGVDVGSPA